MPAEPWLSRLLSAACARSRTFTRSCISARMARPNGCPARRWRCPRTAGRASRSVRLPVIYPFIVDDPGEAAPAKRRIGAVTIGHLHAADDGRRPVSRRGRRPARVGGGILLSPGARTRAARELVAKEILRACASQRTGRRLRRRRRDADGRGADPPRRASLRSRRGDDPRRAARLRQAPAELRGLRRRRARGPAARSRRPLRRAGPVRLALARADRCAADRPQPRDPRSARDPDPRRHGARLRARRRRWCAAICRRKATGRAGS